MGLLNIFKKKEELPPELPPEEVGIGSVLDWFSARFGKELPDSRSRMSGLQGQIKRSFSEIVQSTRALERSEFERGDKTYAAANMIKNTVVKKIRAAAAGVKSPSQMDWETLSGFCTEAQKTVEGMLAMSPKQAILLTRYFGQEAEQLISGIKRTDAQLKELRSFLDAEGRVLRLEQELTKQDAARQEAAGAIRALEKKLGKAQVDRARLEKELKSRQADLKAFLEGAEWKGHKEAEAEAAEIDRRLAELKSRIALGLGPAKRPLKKLRHAGEASPTGGLVELVLQDRETQLAAALKRALELAGSGGVSLKKKDTEKVQGVLRSLETEIPGLKSAYQAQLELREAAGTGQAALESKRRLEEAAEAAKRELEALEPELGGLEKELARARQQLLDTKKQIEELIAGHSDRKVKVNI